MEELQADFDQHVNFVISSLKPIANDIGLNR
jgi:hypothetical protein